MSSTVEYWVLRHTSTGKVALVEDMPGIMGIAVFGSEDRCDSLSEWFLEPEGQWLPAKYDLSDLVDLMTEKGVGMMWFCNGIVDKNETKYRGIPYSVDCLREEIRKNADTSNSTPQVG